MNQTYSNIEYVLVDGNSKDRTLSIINDYIHKFSEKKIDFKVLIEEDNGIYDAINKGLNIATGDIIGFLNADDYYYTFDVLSKIVNEFSLENIDCVYGNMKYVDRQSKKVIRIWKSRNYKKGLFQKSWTPGHPTFYCKKECYNKYGYYKTDYKIAADVELMYRFIEKNNVKTKYLNMFFVYMRIGGVSSKGIGSTLLIIKEMKKAFKENGDKLFLPKYLFFKLLKLKEFFIRDK